MRDEEMKTEEEEEEKKCVSIEMIRAKFKECDVYPYYYQMFNFDESKNWRHPLFTDTIADGAVTAFTKFCKRYQSFDFSIEPTIVGEVKHCSYSELEEITNFKDPEIQKTLTGRLFHGTIVEGSVARPVIVKTWDYLFCTKLENAPRIHKFCDEIELLTDERANTHSNLVKLYKYCFDKRLAVVYDAEFTGVLSDVLLSDDFGWDQRMKVATQLADLFAWLHEKGIAVGSVTSSCIMIDEEVNIKVFDFGFVSNHVKEDSVIPVEALVGREAPEVFGGKRTRTMKSDVFIFGFLLLPLIAKKEFIYKGPHYLEQTVVAEAKCGKKYLVHEGFKEVDHSTAFEITLLAFLCLNINQPDKRPTMKDISDTLRELRARARGEKRKRDENKAE